MFLKKEKKKNSEHTLHFPCVVYNQVKREELLQFAQSAITGLKVNADVSRYDQLDYLVILQMCKIIYPLGMLIYWFMPPTWLHYVA